MGKNLTIKQRKFVDLYLEYGNMTKAAIEAGYSPRNAGQNAAKTLDNPNVKEYLEKRLKQIEDQKIADVTEVMQYLTAGMRQELEEEVVVVEGCGDGISEAVIKKKKISIKDSNKCAELLAKRFGILTDNVNMNMIVPVIGGEDALQD